MNLVLEDADGQELSVLDLRGRRRKKTRSAKGRLCRSTLQIVVSRKSWRNHDFFLVGQESDRGK